MSDDATRSNLLSFIGTQANHLVQPGTPHGAVTDARRQPDPWQALSQVAAAHVVELRRSDVIDDRGFAAIALALVAAREGGPDERSARSLAHQLDQRIDSRTPPSVSGAAMLGLSREEWLATTARLVWREAALGTMAHALTVSDVALLLADTHVVTIMPAFAGGRPSQPTTLAHFLGPLIGPLGSARERLVSAFQQLNRSPLGASLLAGDVLAADREDIAVRLGFGEPVANTLDALSSVEDTVEMVDAVAAALAPVARFVRELGDWIRTDPTSFVLDEGWTTIPEPAHPSLVMSERLDGLAIALAHLEDDLESLRRQLRRAGYGPLGLAQDGVIAAGVELAARLNEPMETATSLLTTGLLVNRAYLGNRAGRGYTTAADLSTFLMTEEQIPPSAARRIAVLVLARLRETGLEVSGITPDMIDSAALLTIGREIKVEMETLGRFLAPRRYIERRQVTGSPAPDQARAWLAGERTRLAGHRQWLVDTSATVDAAMDALEATIQTAADQSLDD
jgi:argininosuccinate lyase